MITPGTVSGQSGSKTLIPSDFSVQDLLNNRGGGSLSCSRGFSSGLREGSVQSLRIKMEQCRNSLAGRYGKRASSSGGASPLPLFHFLFLLLDCVDELSHLRLPPGSPVGHRHGYCIRLILRRESLNMRHGKPDFIDQTFPKYKTDLKNYGNKR